MNILEKARPSQWAFNHRLMKYEDSSIRPYAIDGFEFMIGIHDDPHKSKVVKKGAQIGATETAINMAFWAIDAHRKDVLYVLPDDSTASDFSAGRFDPALECSDYLQKLFTDVSNVGHKRAGLANLYIRGAGGGKSKLKSVPISMLIFDEYDEMRMDRVTLAEHRVSGHEEYSMIRLSTPTIPEWGIDAAYRESSKGVWTIRCCSCNKPQNLTFANFDWDGTNPDSAVIKCRKCDKVWTDNERKQMIINGFWCHAMPDHEVRGYWIPQFYSHVQTAKRIAENYKKSLTDRQSEQEFYNSVLGLAHLIEGAKLDESVIRRNIRDYSLATSWENAAITMGVDVGTWLHIEIALWDGDLKKVIATPKVKDISEVHKLMKLFWVKSCVIDYEPETRMAREFVNAYPGIAWMGDYRGTRDIIALDEKHQLVVISRTETLDITLDRYRTPNKITLPKDISDEYVKHVAALVRVYEKSKEGSLSIPVYRSIDDDHWGHSSNYNEIAHMIWKKQGGQYLSGEALDKLTAPRNDRESSKQPD